MGNSVMSRLHFHFCKPALLAVLLSLLAPSATQAEVVRGPYLQNATPTSVTVMWRTDTASDSRVEYGAAVDALANQAIDSQSTTEHRVQVTGLTPGAKYFYAIGSTGAREIGNDADHFFHAAPPIGTPATTRIWALGDAGTATFGQRAVRDAYLNFDSEHTDLILMLGDNAYGSGTDINYQDKFFDIYPSVLRQSTSYSTRGNHENDEGVYYGIFEHPVAGEAGGVASGTEAYYSFDYGDIHFVCMDSFGSPRAPGDPQYLWLENDLASTTQRWIIAFWHHPPYSFGDHNSDSETGMRRLRENAVPILEQYGVDMVLSGHNHFYSRSVLINGHYDQSGSFDAGTHVVDGGDGIETGDGAYNKGDSPEGAVYVVAGSAGSSESTGAFHPVSFIELSRQGSLVIDIDGDRLDARFVENDGDVGDHVTILKTPLENQPPVVNAGADQSIAVDSSIQLSSSVLDDGLPDPPGSVTLQWTQVAGSPAAVITGATTLTPVISFVAEGSYDFQISATDGEFTRTDDVTVTVGPAVPPAAPTGLTAVSGDGVVNLDWADNSESDLDQYDVFRSTILGGPYGLLSSVTTSQHLDSSVSNDTTYYYVVRARDQGGASSPNSAEVSGTPSSVDIPPERPSGLVAVAGDGVVNLDWADNTEPDLVSYSVKRGTQSGGPYSRVIAPLSSSALADNNVTNGTTYFYRVSAHDAGGHQSPDSLEVSATPTAQGNEAPTVTITDPADGAVYDVGEDVELTAVAADADGSIATVEFFADGQSIGVEVQAPYNATLQGFGSEIVELTAVARDNDGAETMSAPIFVPEPSRWLLQVAAIGVIAAIRRSRFFSTN